MARTRAQEHAEVHGKPIKRSESPRASSRPQARTKALPEAHKQMKRSHCNADLAGVGNGTMPKGEMPSSSKRRKVDGSSSPPDREKPKPSGSINKEKLDKVISAYGVLPLSDCGLAKPNEPTPETILALVFLAMLTSARISHVLAYKSVLCLIEAGYQNVETLKNSTWQERTEVLTKGGYTRYREKTATSLGELADFVVNKYDSDLNNLVKHANSPSKVRSLLQEIKGIGGVGADIFLDSAQGVWPSLAPFVDPRSLDTAEKCGLGSDVNRMWEAVGYNAMEMCKLSSALTTIRLEKKVAAINEKR